VNDGGDASFACAFLSFFGDSFLELLNHRLVLDKDDGSRFSVHGLPPESRRY
jgi:hypothetical protein